jgi:hypothetical protein
MSAPTTHTHGKWYPSQHLCRDGSLGPLKIENGTTVIAEITYREPEEMAANARLIATAPDLLASLEQVTEWMRSHTGPNDGTHDMLVRAVLAITVAGGTIR